ncbi:MAG: hypothetical protein ACOZNI_33145 [Myxococcota bacterium]
MHPGEGLLHPVAIAAIVVLAANDHWGKAAYPGLVTGKLSDFAGLLFFPLLLQGLVELFTRRVDRRVLVASAIATAVVFALVKTTPFVEVYRWGLGLLQAPVRGAWRPVHVEQDPTDLVAIPMVAVAVWIGWRRKD